MPQVWQKKEKKKEFRGYMFLLMCILLQIGRTESHRGIYIFKQPSVNIFICKRRELVWHGFNTCSECLDAAGMDKKKTKVEVWTMGPQRFLFSHKIHTFLQSFKTREKKTSTNKILYFIRFEVLKLATKTSLLP